MNKNFSLLFLLGGLFMLIIGAFAGVMISMVYLLPDFFKDYLPFNQLRPIHTTSIICWIVLTASGGVYYYLSKVEKLKLYAPKLGVLHLVIYFLVAFGIIASYLTNQMGGREYMVFFPLLMVPILLGWVLFGINYFRTLWGNVKNWPVYFWMWGIGIVFMIFHLSEANFWVFDYFRSDYIRDLTVQWKSYGAFVGSWNMLVYGTVIYVMSKIKDDVNLARGKTTFFFFFLGLTNLMFGWAHHTYIVPTMPWVRYVAYGISMTEWIIFIRIIYGWSKSLTKKDKRENSMAYRFIMASDIWVFLNLVMALFMSIPVLNYFSHGTHITVAHSMGTTIGINTCILFASVSFIISKLTPLEKIKKAKKFPFYFFNASLLVFWVALIAMGVHKAIWVNTNPDGLNADLHASSGIYYLIFIIAGVALFLGICMIAIPMIRTLIPACTYTLYPKAIQEEIDHLEEVHSED
ncbi:MAG: cbb3-type cytochrome c oxidase subunit I [Crocinitomicaceae bacterium]|nr:cbb3-type cytochrome c oxidase subunit I [Crocinitomicaceae bacterium]